jgi:hypothetical protein
MNKLEGPIKTDKEYADIYEKMSDGQIARGKLGQHTDDYSTIYEGLAHAPKTPKKPDRKTGILVEEDIEVVVMIDWDNKKVVRAFSPKLLNEAKQFKKEYSDVRSDTGLYKIKICK